jgi:tRNA-binding EMAP/Myf-like protein
MITISKDANPNYLAKIVQLTNIKKHPDADRLQIVTIDFKPVITGMDATEDDVYVYFPLESKINKDFLSFTNSFRDKDLNMDDEKSGFFEDNCRVKAVRLRGEKSMGYIVPITDLESFIGESGLVKYVNEYFDTINGVLLLEEYVVQTKKSGSPTKQGKKPKTSRLVDGQVHLHTNTEHLERNVHKLNMDDEISITYKTHGTSWWTANVMVKKSLTWYEKILKKIGVNIVDTEYDYVYGSRKVVKNKDLEDPKAKDHFYGYDLWEDIKEEVAQHIPKNYTLYGEALGYTKTGTYIQDKYDYRCPEGEFKLEIYRITVTNPDGLVTELSTTEIRDFCERTGLTPSHRFFQGKVKDWMKERGYNLNSWESDRDWREAFIEQLRLEFNEKDCFMCANKVPEEGIVVRRENLFSFDAFKLKAFRFLEKERDDLDAGKLDMETEQKVMQNE